MNNKIQICKVCGKIGFTINGLCQKHYNQVRKFGKTLDANPRTVFDPNEIRVLNGVGEIDTYNSIGEVDHTYTFDLEDLNYLNNHKWRTILKGAKGVPYLCTEHIVYFHRLVMGLPNTEVDHVNRNTLDNRKANLRLANRQLQLINTSIRLDNIQGIKGVYFCTRGDRTKCWRAEIQIGNKHFYSKYFQSKEEACYMRYLYEQQFFKTFAVNNTTIMTNAIKTLSLEQKTNINKYFENRMKVRVEKI